MKRKYLSLNQPMIPSRRQTLGMMTSAAIGAAAFDPLSALIRGLVDGVVAKAQAAGLADSKQPRNYVYIAFPQGPNRFHWDLPLAPYSGLNNPNYVYPTAHLNAGISNRFQGSSLNLEYSSIVVTAPKSQVKLRMPYIWGMDIPTSSGAWIPMASLLDNMIFMRGIQSLDGHVDSQVIQLRPLAGAPSIDGAVADRSTRPVPALALSGSTGRAFGSATGTGNLRVEDLSVSANPLKQILTPFDRTADTLPNDFLTRRQAMNEVMNRALSALNVASSGQIAGADALWSSRATAEKIIRQGIGDVSSVYSTLLLKYQRLVSLCVNEHASGRTLGITDRDLSKSNFADGAQYSNDSINPIDSTITSMFTYVAGRPDQGTNLRGLPESFAIAEYLLINNYSSAVIAGCGGVQGLYVPGGTLWNWDEHGAGTAASIVVNNFAFRAVAACLREFTESLKQGNVFDETIIHLGGEFSRSPRADLKGFDHSPNGNAMSLISGAIKQPFVIGNTLTSNDDDQHPGNYGVGDVMQLDGGLRQPSTGNQVSTLAALLRVSSPKPNDSSMLSEGANGIVPAVELAKNQGESG